MGRPVVHWELWSENPEKISDFYKKASSACRRAMLQQAWNGPIGSED